MFALFKNNNKLIRSNNVSNVFNKKIQVKNINKSVLTYLVTSFG